MNIINQIGVIGDSILKGVVFDEIAGKYKFIKQGAVNLFSRDNKVEIKNYSKFGCTSKKALELLPGALEKCPSQAMLVELGGNDCDYNWSKVLKNPKSNHTPFVPFEEFKKNLSQIIEKILSAGKTPFVMSLPPIDADRYFNWITKGSKENTENLLKFLGNKSLIYRHQELYSRAIESVARQYNLFIVNVREVFLQIHNYTDYLCLDGIHPNEKGQAIIKQIFDSAYKEVVLRQI